MVKGNYTLVRDYVKNNFANALVNFSMWKDRRSRNIWRIKCNSAKYYLSSPEMSGRKKYVLRIIDKNNTLLKTLTFRRMPNRWIDDFNID